MVLHFPKHVRVSDKINSLPVSCELSCQVVKQYFVISMNDYGLRKVSRKFAEEPFRENGVPVGVKLLDFWQWSSSDLLSNTLRGRLAEFLVASALGVADGTRVEWDAIDVVSPSGIKVEVKSSAYLQSWRAKPSRITCRFDIQPRLAWDWDTNNFTSSNPARWSDVYVFCLLEHQDSDSVDPTNLDQWRFFVLSSKELDAKLGNQKTLSLVTLKSLNAKEVAYSALATGIESVAKEG